MEENEIVTPGNVTVVDIQFRPGQKIYFFDPDGMALTAGDHVIMDTARGPEYGICTAGCHSVTANEIVAPLRKVLRKATAQDEKVIAENRAKEKRAFDLCMQKIADHGLDMQLVSAECAFDGSKLLFYFTADERVDFRDLVKDLASVFHIRIELRQIGVRDKAKMVGGLGICGRPFCCASFLDDFQPVSIKMAKTQNLSLNPVKISGTCGRLMCCLKYEQDTYEALIRSLPKADSFVDTVDGRGTVVELDVLRQRVKVRMENNPETIGVYPAEELAVLRSGKAKKTDAPIPADLAPISGSGRKLRKSVENADDEPILESIRFRYSTESVAEEVPAVTESAPEIQPETPAKEEPAERKPNRRRRGNQDRHPEASQPEKKEAPKPKEQSEKGNPQRKKEAKENHETSKEVAEGEKKPNRRRNNFRRRRKPGNSGGNNTNAEG